MKKIRSNFVWVCSGRINLNESMWEMPKSCCVKNESHQNSVKMWKLFSYFVYNTPWNPLFCDLQTVSINLMGHMYLATHFCSVRGLENESNGKWPIFWRLNTGVDPYRNIGFFSVWYIFGQKRPPPVLKLIKSYFYLLIACFLVFLRIFRHFSWIKVAQLVKAVSTHFCPKMKFWPKWRISPEIEQKRGING